MSGTSDKNGSDQENDDRDDEADDAKAEVETKGAEAEGEEQEASAEGDESDEEDSSSESESDDETDGDESDDDVAPAPAEPVPEGPRASWVFLAVVTVLTLAADLGSKIWAEQRFGDVRGPAGRMNVIGDFVLFRLVKNKGGAWGILGGESETLRIGFFVTISIVAVAFIVSLYRKTMRSQKALMWGLPLVLGGALGNLVDRIRYGMVVDFIEVHIGSYQHPTFNIADIAIVVGVGLMAIDMFTPRRREATSPKETSEKVSEPSG